MMNGDPRSTLLIGLGIAAALLIAICLVLLRIISRQDRLAARVKTVLGTTPGTIAPLLTNGGFTPAPGEETSIKQRILNIFGVNLERAGDYPVRWWVIIIVALPLARIGCGLVATILGEWLVYLTPLAWVYFSRAFFSWAEERRRITLFRQFPDALAMVVRAVRVGIPLNDGLAAAARESPQPTAREFQAITDRIAIGMQIHEALAETAAKNGVPEYKFFSTAIALQSRTGGSPSEALDNLADVIRKRVALQERGKALASQARSSAVVLALLPIGTALLLLAVDFNYMSLLFTDPVGQQILGAAIALLVIGMFTMRTMIKRSLS